MCRVGSCSNMQSILLLSILSLSLALPSQVSDAPPRPNCIKMSPEKEQQIDQIVEKLEQFLNNLTIEHEHFDIRLLKLSIEQHTEGEEEKETVLQLSVNDCQLVDDDLEEIDHHRENAKLEREKAKKEKEADFKKESDSSKKQDQTSEKSQQENNKNAQSHEATEINTKQADQCSVNKPAASEQNDNFKNNGINVKQENLKNDQEEYTFKNKEREVRSDGQEEEQLSDNDKEVRPEVMHLDLGDNGQKIVEALGRKKKNPIIVYVQERNSGQSEYWFLKRR